MNFPESPGLRFCTKNIFRRPNEVDMLGNAVRERGAAKVKFQSILVISFRQF